MKKIILFPSITLILFSCGPSEEELANEKKNFLHSVDSLLSVYEVQINDYCKCLETETSDFCKSKHRTASATWMNLNRKADEAHHYIKVVSEIMAIRDKTAALMDKGAHCAQAPNKAEAAAFGIQLHDESADKQPAAEETKTAKTTSKAKSKTEDNSKEEEHHSEEKKSDNPF